MAYPPPKDPSYMWPNEPPPPYSSSAPPGQSYPQQTGSVRSNSGLMGTLGSVYKEVEGVVRGVTKAGAKAVKKMMDRPTVDLFQNGHIVQLICRTTGRSIQIMQAPNGLVMDGLGGEGQQYFNTHFTVFREPGDIVLLHNNFNYIAIINGQTRLFCAGPGGVVTSNCRLRIREVPIQNQFILLESADERSRYVAVLPNGQLKSALATSPVDHDTQFGVRLIYGTGGQTSKP